MNSQRPPFPRTASFLVLLTVALLTGCATTKVRVNVPRAPLFSLADASSLAIERAGQCRKVTFGPEKDDNTVAAADAGFFQVSLSVGDKLRRREAQCDESQLYAQLRETLVSRLATDAASHGVRMARDVEPDGRQVSFAWNAQPSRWVRVQPRKDTGSNTTCAETCGRPNCLDYSEEAALIFEAALSMQMDDGFDEGEESSGRVNLGSRNAVLCHEGAVGSAMASSTFDWKYGWTKMYAQLESQLVARAFKAYDEVVDLPLFNIGGSKGNKKGIQLAKAGDWTGATIAFHAAIGEVETLQPDDPEPKARALHNSSVARMQDGLLDEALEQVRESLRIAEMDENRWLEAEILRRLADKGRM